MAGESNAPRLNAAECAWFLDVDGTLVDIADTPDAVRVEAGLVLTLDRLASAGDGAVALISGRRIEEIDGLFAPLRLPAAGQHGMELRIGEGRLRLHAPETDFLSRARVAIAGWAAERPGLLVEDKGITLAVHFRQAPRLHDEVRLFLGRLVDDARGEYCLQPGKMVFEIRPAGRDKGTAVLNFMDSAPFRGRMPVFVGDDATDEYAFSVVDGLGGVAVKVGPGVSVAGWRLPDVPAVHGWIRDWLGRA